MDKIVGTGMEIGLRYRIRYRRFGGRVIDECVAQYLGMKKNDYNSQRDEFVINLRPAAGTSGIERSQIQSVEQTEDPIHRPTRSPNQEGRSE